MKTRIIFLNLVAGLFFIPAVNLFAQMEGFSGDGYPNIYGTILGLTSGVTIGSEFRLSSTTTISALGVFNGGAFNDYSHDVGIWDTSGDLLGEVTVPAGTPSYIGYFSFENLSTPIVLNAGDYIVGADYEVGYPHGSDEETVDELGASVNCNPGVTWVAPLMSPDEAGLNFPTLAGNRGDTMGPNFIVQFAVPEPSTIGLLGMGAAMLLAWRNRRKAYIISLRK